MIHLLSMLVVLVGLFDVNKQKTILKGRFDPECNNTNQEAGMGKYGAAIIRIVPTNLCH